MLILTATADVSLSSRTTGTAPVPAVNQGKAKNNSFIYKKSITGKIFGRFAFVTEIVQYIILISHYAFIFQQIITKGF